MTKQHDVEQDETSGKKETLRSRIFTHVLVGPGSEELHKLSSINGVYI